MRSPWTSDGPGFGTYRGQYTPLSNRRLRAAGHANGGERLASITPLHGDVRTVLKTPLRRRPKKYGLRDAIVVSKFPINASRVDGLYSRCRRAGPPEVSRGGSACSKAFRIRQALLLKSVPLMDGPNDGGGWTGSLLGGERFPICTKRQQLPRFKARRRTHPSYRKISSSCT